MVEKVIKLNSLKKALARLEEGLSKAKDELDYDGVIQRFEFSFELLWKTIQEYAKNEGLEVYSPKEAFRVGGELDLIDKVEDWFEFLHQRNLTVHIYNQKMAKEVINNVPKFLEEAKRVVEKMERKN